MSHERLVRDWLEGLERPRPGPRARPLRRGRRLPEPDRAARRPDGDGTLRGRDAIRQLYERALARFPKLRFELEDVIERPSGVMVLHRKHNVFAARAGLTVETFETAGGLVTRNAVYWSAEEVAARFRPI